MKIYAQLPHLDANESAFFQRELEYVKSNTYDVKYPELKARRLFPLNPEVDPGATKITYQQYDQTGIAKIIANYADDLPRADIKGKEFKYCKHGISQKVMYFAIFVKTILNSSFNIHRHK